MSTTRTSKKGKTLTCEVDKNGVVYQHHQVIDATLTYHVGTLATVVYKGAPFTGRLIHSRFHGRLEKKRRSPHQYRAPISTIYEHR